MWAEPAQFYRRLIGDSREISPHARNTSHSPIGEHMPNSKNRTQIARTSGVACQALESRLLFIGFSVDGTSGADTFSVGISGNDILFVLNGVSDTRSDFIYNEVTFNGLGGNDVVSIINTGDNHVIINGGSGGDSINAGNGGNNLDDIGEITINGDADSDSVALFDQNETAGFQFDFQDGNELVRRDSTQYIWTFNAESVTLHAGSGDNDVEFELPPTFNTTVNGNAGTDRITLLGSGGAAASYTPSATTPGNGSILFGTRSMNFTSAASVQASGFTAPFTFVTPNAIDVLSLSGNILSGTSTGVSFTQFQFGLMSTVVIDTATNDGGAGSDSITLNTTQPNVFGINAGTGSNTLFLSSTPTVDTDYGTASGTNLRVFVNNGTATFAGFQNLERLEINNNATAQFSGSGTVLNTRELAVVTNSGNIHVTSGQTAVCTLNGSFALGAGRTMNKSGSGTLNINAAQSHGAGAFFNALGGTTNFQTNAGSAAARPLSAHADGATLNLNATQHLNIVSTGVGGRINVGTNGNRVLVCNQVFIESEGSSINLNDNDMIVDYSGASQVEAIRQLIANGYANATWNGIGIVSDTAAAAGNTALGYADATQLFTTFPATFSGQQVDNTAVLVKYTFNGDSDLNGNVNLNDFNRLAANFGTANKRWIHGDSDYNLSINLIDFNKLAATFGLSGLGPNGSGSPFFGGKSIADEIFTEA
jgi:hypothetical protein